MATSGMSMDPATSLGLGGLGDQLRDQVTGETDEERKRRLKALQDGGLFGDRQRPGFGSIFGAGSGRGGFASQLFGSYGR